MIINLAEYGKELRYWIDGFEQFVDHASVPALKRIREDLESGQDNRQEFPWKTPKPIRLKIADRYDGIGKFSHKVYITWAFTCYFKKRTPTKKKSTLWDTSKLVTHTRVHDAITDGVILHFHHDLKNPAQLGPYAHFQISEMFMEDKANVPLAVPRFPSAALLPTDCLDLVLSEFFPDEWRESQSGIVGISTLRSRQLARATAYVKELYEQSEKNKKITPFALLQNCFFPNLQLA